MSQTSDGSTLRLTAFGPLPRGPARSAARLRLQSAYGLPPPEPRQVPHQPNTRYPEKFPPNGKLQKERYTAYAVSGDGGENWKMYNKFQYSYESYLKNPKQPFWVEQGLVTQSGTVVLFLSQLEQQDQGGFRHVLVIRFGGPNCLLLMSMEAEGVARRTLVLVNPEDRSALGMQDSLAHKVVNSTSGLERASYLDGWFWPFAVVHSTFSGKFECPLLGAPFDCDQIRRSLQDWVPLHRMGNYTNQATLVWVCRITSGVASLLPNDGTAKKSPSAGVPFHRPPITINQGNPEKFFPPAIVWPPAT